MNLTDLVHFPSQAPIGLLYSQNATDSGFELKRIAVAQGALEMQRKEKFTLRVFRNAAVNGDWVGNLTQAPIASVFVQPSVEFIRALNRLECLSELTVYKTRLDAEFLTALSTVRQIRSVTFEDCCLGTNDLSALSGLAHLQKLAFINTSMSDAPLNGLVRGCGVEVFVTQNSLKSTSDLALFSMLDQLPGLTSITLNGTDCTDDEFLKVSHFKMLKILKLNNSPKLTRNAYSVLSELKYLESLNISGCGEGGACLDVVGQIESLKKFTLNCVDASGKHLQCLSSLRLLEKLDLYLTALSPYACNSLPTLPKLKSLNLSGTQIEKLDGLSGRSGLQTLDLSNNRVDIASLNALSGLDSLESLSLRGTWCVLESLPAICRSPKLKYLDLCFTETTDSACAKLSELAFLKHLDLSDTNVSGKCFPSLAEIPNIQTLCLTSIDNGEHGNLSTLCKAKTLQHLSLDTYWLDSNQLPYLTSLVNLRGLHLRGGGMRSSDFRFLSQFGHLEELTLSRQEGVDRHSLADLPKSLRSLDLEASGITDGDVESLLNLEDLEDLSLAGTSITDSALQILEELKCLRKLDLIGTKITSEAWTILDRFPALERVEVRNTAATGSKM